MQQPSDHEVILAMRKYGGGFVSALADAAHRADDDNLQRIKSTWPEYWIKYAELANISKAKAAHDQTT